MDTASHENAPDASKPSATEVTYRAAWIGAPVPQLLLCQDLPLNRMPKCTW